MAIKAVLLKHTHTRRDKGLGATQGALRAIPCSVLGDCSWWHSLCGRELEADLCRASVFTPELSLQWGKMIPFLSDPRQTSRSKLRGALFLSNAAEMTAVNAAEKSGHPGSVECLHWRNGPLGTPIDSPQVRDGFEKSQNLIICSSGTRVQASLALLNFTTTFCSLKPPVLQPCSLT